MRLALLALLLASTAAAGVLPERRRSQFPTDSGYAMAPYLYNLPGIGWGYGVLGAAMNIDHSCTDVAGTLFFGEANGQAASVDQLYLVPRHLMLDAGGAHISRASLQSFAQRGMGSGKNDFSLAEFAEMYFAGARLTGSLEDRRFEAFAGYYLGSAELRSLRDRDGNVILSSDNSAKLYMTTWIFGLRADMTDDYFDPRRGLRLEPSLWRAPRRGSGPDYYFIDVNTTGYVPLGRRSTWAFNFFSSDAHVMNKGETDPAALQRQQGLECSTISDTAQRTKCLEYIDTLAAQNAYGTATMLGGFNRLRSYPEGRFKGAHAQAFGSEIRWNLTDEVKPFNIYVMKDIRTAVQVAFFYEIGTVSDTQGALWRSSRSSYGTGFRVVTASGLVYRADIAAGDEGWQPSAFFQYPWEL